MAFHSESEASPTKTAALWTLMCFQVIGGIIAVPWVPLGWFLSGFLFDAPKAAESPLTWVALILAVGWPWMFFAARVKAWKLYRDDRPWMGVLLMSVTLAPAAFVCAAFAVTFANEGISVEERWARIKKAEAKTVFADPLQRRLADSISRGDVAAMEAALREGADPNTRGKHGLTMLLWAVAKRCLPAFETLLANGADIEADLGESFYNTWGNPPKTVVEQIVIDDDPAFLRAAIAHGLGPDHTPDRERQETLLQLAVEAGATKSIQLLIDEGADLTHRSKYGGPPMSDAFAGNRYDIVLLLLNRGANAQLKDRWGMSIADGIRVTGLPRLTPDQTLDYARVVEELRKRGLLSDDDAKDAFTPKQPVP